MRFPYQEGHSKGLCVQDNCEAGVHNKIDLRNDDQIAFLTLPSSCRPVEKKRKKAKCHILQRQEQIKIYQQSLVVEVGKVGTNT